MSFTFSVKTDKSISHRNFVALFGRKDLCDGYAPEDSNAPLSGLHVFYLDEISCRGISVDREAAGSYTVLINVPCSIEDFKLGIRAAELLARQFQAEVEADGRSMSADRLVAEYDDEWVRKQFDDAADLALSTAQGAIVSMEGAVRHFYLGKRMVTEICKGRSQPEARAELMSRMHQCQYLGPEYFVPKEWQITSTQKKFTVLGPGVQTVLPWVQYIGLMPVKEPGDVVYVPYNLLPELAGTSLTWLDEKQALIAPIAEERWPAVIKIASPHVVDLIPSMKEGGVIPIISRAKSRFDRLMAR